jgi:hypothetical protein
VLIGAVRAGTHALGTAVGQAQLALVVRAPHGPSCSGSNHRGEARGKTHPATRGIATKELSGVKLESH